MNHTETQAVPWRAWPWLHLAWFGALLVLCYAPVLQNITHQWQADEYMGHGVFVPLLVAYIIWERRALLFEQPVARSRWGLAFVVLGAAQACAGALAAEIFVERVAFLVSLFGLVLYFGGARVVRVLGFPLALLLFMIPIPGIVYKQITFPLQMLASRLAENGLELMGYLVVREGNILELAGQRLSVAEACSGIRALLSLSFFSLAYAYLVSDRPWMRWALLAAAVPVAVLANAARVVTTAMLAERDPQLAQGFFHGFSGWVIFVFAIALLIAVHRLLVRLKTAP